MAWFASADLTSATNNLVYTVAGGASSLPGGATINVRCANRNSSAVTVNIYWVPSGQSVGVAYAIVYGHTIQANGVMEEVGLTPGTGDKIYVNPSTSGVTCTIFGFNN